MRISSVEGDVRLPCGEVLQGCGPATVHSEVADVLGHVNQHVTAEQVRGVI
jgi:hypothetical protein